MANYFAHSPLLVENPVLLQEVALGAQPAHMLAPVISECALETGRCKTCGETLYRAPNLGQWQCWKRSQISYRHPYTAATVSRVIEVRSDHLLQSCRKTWDGTDAAAILSLPTTTVAALQEKPLADAVAAGHWAADTHASAVAPVAGMRATTSIARYDIKTEREIVRTFASFMRTNALPRVASWMETAAQRYVDTHLAVKVGGPWNVLRVHAFVTGPSGPAEYARAPGARIRIP